VGSLTKSGGRLGRCSWPMTRLNALGAMRGLCKRSEEAGEAHRKTMDSIVHFQ